MLLNKILLDNNFIIPRTADPKVLRYLMDMGLHPIVILKPLFPPKIYVRWGNTDFYSLLYDDIMNLPKPYTDIRPLNVTEIKSLFSDLKLYVEVARALKYPLEYIISTYLIKGITVSRDSLWKKL